MYWYEILEKRREKSRLGSIRGSVVDYVTISSCILT